MSEEDTYLRAKLTEINGSIERLTDMLNKMIEVVSRMGDIQDAASEMKLVAQANSEKLDDLLQKVDTIAKSSQGIAQVGASLGQRGSVSSLTSVLDNLETQIREGVIASDLAVKISDATETLEDRGVSGSLIVKMNRWVRILKTYSRVDTISPQDLSKLRQDLRDWHSELESMR
ncbi:hypothetical protein EU537_10910 [Candidatus Thorarchaeota archaeon]|nr:MAG: hypothetical protein EU537_10910 [Candidatus Thorarchaeota archaeon]